MADLSNYCFTGRLGADAQVKTINDKKLLEVSVAVNTGYGNNKKTTWYKIKVWGNRADTLAPMLLKGTAVAGCGELSTNEWDGNDGKHHTDLEINCSVINVQSSGKKQDDNATPANEVGSDPNVEW